MSKAIVKHGGGLAGVAGNVAEVMALLEGRTLSPAVPEIFDLYCFCAIHDKPYTLRFERQSSGLLRFKESIKGKPKTPGSDPAVFAVHYEAGVKMGWKLSMKYFEHGTMPCAWCGDGSFGHCSQDCGALVCCGRMRGNTFHCRPSCGASWVGVPMREVTGTTTRERPPANRVSLSSAPAKPLLLLPAGSSLPARRK
jgi:hypothetical protein